MTDNIIHATTCNCPVCTLIANNVTIMDVLITIHKEENETGMRVPVYAPYLALQANEQVSTAIRDIVTDFHYTSMLRVGHTSFNAGDRHELFLSRTSRYCYTFCFHTKPLKVEPELESPEVLGD